MHLIEAHKMMVSCKSVCHVSHCIFYCSVCSAIIPKKIVVNRIEEALVHSTRIKWSLVAFLLALSINDLIDHQSQFILYQKAFARTKLQIYNQIISFLLVNSLNSWSIDQRLKKITFISLNDHPHKTMYVLSECMFIDW